MPESELPVCPHCKQRNPPLVLIDWSSFDTQEPGAPTLRFKEWDKLSAVMKCFLCGGMLTIEWSAQVVRKVP